jgi:hypothetical protein
MFVILSAAKNLLLPLPLLLPLLLPLPLPLPLPLLLPEGRRRLQPPHQSHKFVRALAPEDSISRGVHICSPLPHKLVNLLKTEVIQPIELGELRHDFAKPRGFLQFISLESCETVTPVLPKTFIDLKVVNSI